MSRIQTQIAININTVHLLHPKKEEKRMLYCIKIHATAWHSLVIKTREGEPTKGGKRKKNWGVKRGGKHSRERDRTEGGKRRKKPCTAGGVKID